MAKRKLKGSRAFGWIAETTTPALLLDARRRVIVFNTGCSRLTGWEAEDVVGKVCHYASDAPADTVESLTGRVAPPDEVWHGHACSVDVQLRHREGRLVDRRLHFFPLTNDGGEIERVLGIFTPPEGVVSTSRMTPSQKLHAELAVAHNRLQQRYQLDAFLAQTSAMQRVVTQIEAARATSASVHLVGEAGVGREHVARLIHAGSSRRRQAFVPIDCDLLRDEELHESLSRIYGWEQHEQSSIERLQPGTLYLHNVHKLPKHIQERIVETRETAATSTSGPARPRLTSSSPHHVSHAHTDELLPEFVYLLTSLVITVPTVRERFDELPLLAQHLLERCNHNNEHQVTGFADDVWSLFKKYRWPGNVAELAAVIEEAHATSTSSVVGVGDLPFRFRSGFDAQTVAPAEAPRPIDLEAVLHQQEIRYIQQALDDAGGNKSAAAELLGLTRAKFYRRLRTLGLET